MLKIEATFESNRKKDFVSHLIYKAEKAGYSVKYVYLSGEYDIFLHKEQDKVIMRVRIDPPYKPNTNTNDKLSYLEVEGFSEQAVYIIAEVMKTAFVTFDFAI
jgi:16S rRNA G966 N2-methylase RsmD